MASVQNQHYQNPLVLSDMTKAWSYSPHWEHKNPVANCHSPYLGVCMLVTVRRSRREYEERNSRRTESAPGNRIVLTIAKYRIMTATLALLADNRLLTSCLFPLWNTREGGYQWCSPGSQGKKRALLHIGRAWPSPVFWGI